MRKARTRDNELAQPLQSNLLEGVAEFGKDVGIFGVRQVIDRHSMKISPYEFKLKRQVEFGDTDMAGIMHFSNFFRFMEAAETAFFRSLGLSIVTTGFDKPIGWPRVHADCDFIHPLRFEDIVEVHLLVREKKKRSIVYDFVFRNLNEHPAREVARGTLVVACVTRDSLSGRMVAIPIPPSIADKIGVAPKDVLEKIDKT